MSDDIERALSGVDGPRSLPAELRDRLFERLTIGAAETTAMPLGDELDSRLERQLSDPVALLLADVDGPRALAPAFRDRLREQLSTSRVSETRRAQRFLGAAAVLVLVVAVAVVATYGGSRATRRPSAQGVNGATVTSPPSVSGNTAEGGSQTGNAGAGTGGVLQPSSAPRPAPSPAVAEGQPGVQPAGAPAVRDLSPDAGPIAGGTAVTIHGSGFTDAVAVTFAGRSAHFTIGSDGSIRAVTPPASDPATVDVVVQLRNGETARLANAFAYLDRPGISGVSPATGSTRGGTWVTISGRALLRATQVRFGATPASKLQVISDGQLRALSPQHAAGPVDVTVTTPGGTSATGSGDRFTYLL